MKTLILTALIILSLMIGSAAGADPFEYEPQVTFIGSDQYSAYGAVVLIADFNGNGWPDFITSEPYTEDNSGRVLIYFDVNDFPAGVINTVETPADISLVGLSEDEIGNEVETCDFNGDGISDIVFNREHWGGRDEYLFVFFGGSQWQPGIVITDLEGEADVVIIPNEENEEYFRWPFICGDINGDEYADLLAGAFPVAVLGEDYPSGTTLDLTTSSPAVQFTGIFDDVLYYRFLADVNGDGRNDFLFSESDSLGILRIWFGFEEYSTPRVIDPDLNPPDVMEVGPYLYSAYHLVDTGDWNGDGAADMLLSQSYVMGEEYFIYRLNPGEVGMQPGHEFEYTFAVMTEDYPLRLTDMNGDNQLDLTLLASEFYWDRSAFPQTGHWDLWDYEPQGIYWGDIRRGNVLAGNLDNDGQQDVIFYKTSNPETGYGQVDLYFTSPRPGDDDDTGDDDTGDDDTGPDDDDDTGPDDDDDNDTGPDDDDNDTGSDDDDDNDTGPDDDDDNDDDNDNDDDDDGCGC